MKQRYQKLCSATLNSLIRWTSKLDNFIFFSTPTFVTWCFRVFRKVCNMIPLFSQKHLKEDMLAFFLLEKNEIMLNEVKCGSIHQGHEWFSDDSRRRQEIFMCLTALLCEQFCRFANGSAKISIKSYFFSMYSTVVKWSASIRNKLLTAACWSRKERKVWSRPAFNMSKATSVPQTNTVFIRISAALE